MPEPHSNVGKLIRSTEVILNVPKYVPRPVWTNLKVMMGSIILYFVSCCVASRRVASGVDTVSLVLHLVTVVIFS